MKRWLFKVVVFLLLGAIINIAVAWGIALYGPFHEARWDDILSDSENAYWNERLKLQHVPADYRITTITSTGFRAVVLWQRGQFERSERECRVGWPLLCSRPLGPDNEYKGIPIETRVLSQPQAEMDFLFGERRLPTTFFMAASAINSIVYGLTLWSLFTEILLVRRQLRIRRGLCSKCKYPIGVSDTCTECGRPVKCKIVTQKAESA